MRQCPGCGKERVRLSLVETVPGEMVEVNPDSLLPAYLRNREHVWDQLCSYALQKKSDATDPDRARRFVAAKRSEEHTSELQSLMRISYAVFCLKKKKRNEILIQVTTYYDHNSHLAQIYIYLT